MTQTDQVLNALKSGRELTPLEALREFGCMRLGARIWDLRQAGYQIIARAVEVCGRNGTARVAAYRLQQVNESPE